MAIRQSDIVPYRAQASKRMSSKLVKEAKATKK